MKPHGLLMLFQIPVSRNCILSRVLDSLVGYVDRPCSIDLGRDVLRKEAIPTSRLPKITRGRCKDPSKWEAMTGVDARLSLVAEKMI